MPLPTFELEFTREGEVYDEGQRTQALDGATGLTDLIVLAHGWNNDKADAKRLYDALCANVERVLAADVVPDLSGRRFGVLRVFWPSKKFADADLIPGGGAASATQENDAALLRLLEQMKSDPERLGSEGGNAARSSSIAAAQALVPRLDREEAARREFVLHLRALLDPAGAHPDDGTQEFFTVDPLDIFESFEEPVPAPAATGGGGAAALDGAGGAAGLGDLLSGVKAAARRIANFASYYEMKQRAGTVGRSGLAPVLRQLRERAPALRLHLVGHSFGGRLITAAAHSLPARTPAVSMTLLQAAFSHNGLASRFDEKNDGAFREVMSEARISGPIVITHTKNDRAVGIAYPLASRISRQQASALGDQDDPYGGMGRNGAQHMGNEAQDGELLAVGNAYTFAPGRVFNLRADDFIKDHSDVTGEQVAYALVAVTAAA